MNEVKKFLQEAHLEDYWPAFENNDDPHHWDIGLYLTGTDTYDMTNGQKDDYLGLSYEGDMCDTNYSCAMVEFGMNKGIALGFASSLTAVHEIAHVLGIPGDNETIYPYCPTYEHIMAQSKYYRNQITWSDCSSDVAKELWRTKTCLLDYTNQKNHVDTLDHLRYHDLPGRKWTAKAQCELYLLDKYANVVTLHDICQTLQCETPNRDKYFFAGPALDGTHCAPKKECRGGDCVPVLEPPYIFKYCVKDNWGEWKKDSCNSSCLENSKGVIIKRRSCMHRGYKTTSCEGPYYAIDLCDDSNICKSRTTIKEYTTTKCTDFSLAEERYGGKMYEYLYEKEAGDWGNYQEDDPSEGCVIYCKRKNFNYYHPSKEILNFGVDPYFPDGTWCHNENGQDYYCRQHYCLPENYSDEE